MNCAVDSRGTVTTSAGPEVKPCPFCGAEPVIADRIYSSASGQPFRWIVFCPKPVYSHSASVLGSSRTAAILKWNRRTKGAAA